MVNPYNLPPPPSVTPIFRQVVPAAQFGALPVASSQAKHGDVMVSQTKGRLCPQGAFMEQTANHSRWSARAIAVTANSFLIHIYHNDPISRLVGLGGWTDGLMDWWTDGLTEVNKDLHKAQHSCNYFELDLQYAAARSLVSIEGWILNLCV